jgi:hypothetical protein
LGSEISIRTATAWRTSHLTTSEKEVLDVISGGRGLVSLVGGEGEHDNEDARVIRMGRWARD